MDKDKKKKVKTKEQLKSEAVSAAKTFFRKVIMFELADHSSHRRNMLKRMICTHFDRVNGRDLWSEFDNLEREILSKNGGSQPVAEMSVQEGGKGAVHTSRSGQKYKVQSYSRGDFENLQKKSSETGMKNVQHANQVQGKTWHNKQEGGQKEEASKEEIKSEEIELFESIVSKPNGELLEEFGGLTGLVAFVNSYISEEKDQVVAEGGMNNVDKVIDDCKALIAVKLEELQK